MLRKFAVLTLVGTTLALAGCGGGGASSDTQVQNTTVSKGQALIDLKKALDAGAISQSEYDKQRQKILNE